MPTITIIGSHQDFPAVLHQRLLDHAAAPPFTAPILLDIFAEMTMPTLCSNSVSIDHVDSGNCAIHISHLQLPYRVGVHAMANAYCDTPKVTATVLHDDIYAISIESATSLRAAVSVLLTLCVLQIAGATKDVKTQVIATSDLKRYIEILNVAQAPYFLRYLLSKDAIKSEELFETLKPALQTVGLTLNPSHSQQHRYHAIEKRLPGGGELVDIGCGKGFYLCQLASRYASVIGYEVHDPTRKEAQWHLRKKGLKNVQVCGAFGADEYISPGSHVLMTEVLEHMPRATAVCFLSLLAVQSAADMIFTVPNHDFNRHYGIPYNEFRHWDHHWEPTTAEFIDMMKNIMGKRWRLEFLGIGDAVDGVFSSNLCHAVRL